MTELAERDKAIIRRAMSAAMSTAAMCVEQMIPCLPDDVTPAEALQAAVSTIRAVSNKQWPDEGVA